jgi:hypothetical protein
MQIIERYGEFLVAFLSFKTGVQIKNNAYHNGYEPYGYKVKISFISTLILKLIDIMICVVSALHSSNNF